MMVLDPFSDTATCPKCWSDDVGTTFHADAHSTTCALYRVTREPECCTAEHLCRTCCRCRYGWAQAIAPAAYEASK